MKAKGQVRGCTHKASVIFLTIHLCKPITKGALLISVRRTVCAKQSVQKSTNFMPTENNCMIPRRNQPPWLQLFYPNVTGNSVNSIRSHKIGNSGSAKHCTQSFSHSLCFNKSNSITLDNKTIKLTQRKQEKRWAKIVSKGLVSKEIAVLRRCGLFLLTKRFVACCQE